MKSRLLPLAARSIEAGRALLLRSPASYALLGAPWAQPLLVRGGMLRARAVCDRASRNCPAYCAFLQEQGFVAKKGFDLAELPVTNKANYVRKYSMEARCYGGTIPVAGVIIDESSGSSGAPNNWVRGPRERADVMQSMQYSYRMRFPTEKHLFLNCFALGPWATGMNVSFALAGSGILKSIGPDCEKLENTLRQFGPGYRYLLFGYPPFIRSFLDSTRMDLSAYHLDLVVGGEGMSEGLRTYLLRTFRSVLSSFGASDLEINIGIETDLTIALRRRCDRDPILCQALFGRETPPMLFQYNPLDYVIEVLPGGELIFTVTRWDTVAPKIRYNLQDQGGIMSFRELETRLADQGIDLTDLSESRPAALPLLYVFGRGDMTVPFYGAKVYPADIEAILSADAALLSRVNSFQLRTEEDSNHRNTLHIALETVAGHSESFPAPEELGRFFFTALCRVNQDFREVARLFDSACIVVTLYTYGTGPFRNRDLRIKNRYLGTEGDTPSGGVL